MRKVISDEEFITAFNAMTNAEAAIHFGKSRSWVEKRATKLNLKKKRGRPSLPKIIF